MLERKVVILKLQRMLAEVYNDFLDIEDDQERDDYINAFDRIQRELEKIYASWGYEFVGTYEPHGLKLIADENKTPKGKGEK